MTKRNNILALRNRPGQVVLGLLLLVVCLHSAGIAVAEELAVPAEFIRDIKMPGLGNGIQRPTVLHYDRFHDEIMIGDSGHNRILIFGSNGVFHFSFNLNEIMTTPRDITTDPGGFIYVLGSDPSGQVLFRFDFDGAPLEALSVPRSHEGLGLELRNLACAENGDLFALDHLGRRVLELNSDGTVKNSINLEREASVAVRLTDDEGWGEGAFALSSLTCVGGTLYVAVSNLGTVLTYSTEGEYLKSIGSFGAKTGFLNFPVDVAVSPEGLILVLDKPRYCVVSYSPEGKFLGEFGGRGISPGWFMGPSLLVVPDAGRAIVGQLFDNKIQVCAIPDFIRTKAGRVSTEQASDTEDISMSSSEARHPFANDIRRLSENSRSVLSPDVEFSPSTSSNAHVAQNVSLPEVSE